MGAAPSGKGGLLHAFDPEGKLLREIQPPIESYETLSRALNPVSSGLPERSGRMRWIPGRNMAIEPRHAAGATAIGAGRGWPAVPWVALVGPEIEENLGIRYLTGSLISAGFAVEILRFDQEHDLRPVLGALTEGPLPPFLVGLSLSFQWRAMDFLALAVALRENGYSGHVTAGGHFGSISYREILQDFPELDSICRGESEEIVVGLARALTGQGAVAAVPGLAIRDGHGRVVLTGLPDKPDLSRLPWPDRRGPARACLGHRVAPLVASRGCYGRCAFCCIATLHRSTSRGPVHRMRPAHDVAAEMERLARRRGVDIFIFHDDNFLPRGREESLDRIHSLSMELASRGLDRYATVIKARPDDISPETVRALAGELQLIRLFLGVESGTDRGLATLARGVDKRQNERALSILREAGIYVCFNMLVFDPDTTPDSLLESMAFLDENGDYPSNFGRAELYSGTPLLDRLQLEGRCHGDYLRWGYRLATPEMQRIFDLAMRCFFPRNFGEAALANRMMGTRFEVEVCRRFHRDVYRSDWLDEVVALHRELAGDSTRGVQEIVAHVVGGAPGSKDDRFVTDLADRLRRAEERIDFRATDLESTLREATGVQVEGQP